jgi:DUF4097 and DUF4098 domain-containing protein YvlB
MSHPLRCATLTLLTTATLVAANVATAAEGSFRETLDVGSALELEVTTGSGSITIREGAAGRAEIVGEIRAFDGGFFFWRSGADAEEVVRALEADPPIELEGGRLRIGHIDDPDFRHNVSISYEITVPADTAVQSHTGSGSQTVSGIAAPVTAGTGSGSIELANIHGDVRASTGSGGIRAAGIAGAFSGRTGSGSVALEQTASGAVDVTTGSGSVRIRLPQDAAFELDARTGSGGITTDRPLTIQGRLERNGIRGSAGSGGPPIRVRTGSGSVRIE